MRQIAPLMIIVSSMMGQSKMAKSLTNPETPITHKSHRRAPVVQRVSRISDQCPSPISKQDQATTAEFSCPDPRVVSAVQRVSTTSGKATAPVRIDLQPGAVLQSGLQYVRLSVTPSVDASAVLLSYRASEGLAVKDDAKEWQLSVNKEKESGRTFLVEDAGPGQKRLFVSATLVLPDKRKQTAVATFLLQPDAQHAGQLTGLFPAGKFVSTDDGSVVQELPGKSK